MKFEVIMILRVWALWTRSRWVGAGLAILSAAALVVTGIAYVKFSQNRKCEHEPAQDLSHLSPNPSSPVYRMIDDKDVIINQVGCRPMDGSNAERIIFIMVTVFEIRE